MTVFEHALFGASLALAAGLHRRYGWRIAAMSAVAAALPDWDGLTVLGGGDLYTRGHRIWGHNLLVASLLGGLVGGLDYVLGVSGKAVRKAVLAFPDLAAKGPPPRPGPAPGRSWHGLTVWVLTGVLASLSHLPIDILYAGNRSQQAWPITLLWPFSDGQWAFPVIGWGDLGATLLFVVEMFALYRWPSRAQAIAGLTLAAVLGYVVVRWAISGLLA